MAVTARDTIQGALKLLGKFDPNETMEPEDAADGLIMLNDLVDQWSLQDLNLYGTDVVTATVTNGIATVGPSGVFNIVRPVTINHAFYRKSGIDYGMQPATDAQWDAIEIKSQAGDFPSVFWYSNDSPLATLYLWPVPVSLAVYLNVDIQITQFADLDTSYSLPQGYRMALKYALAPHLAPLYQTQVPAIVMNNMAAAMRILKRSNVVVPDLKLDSHGSGEGRFNILSNTHS